MPTKTKSAAPKGAKNPRAPEPASLTPLDVMLDIMRKHHAAGDLAEALAAAKAAAPIYYAQRKGAEQRDAIDPESMSHDELERRITELVTAIESMGGIAGIGIVPAPKEPPAGT